MAWTKGIGSETRGTQERGAVEISKETIQPEQFNMTMQHVIAFLIGACLNSIFVIVFTKAQDVNDNTKNQKRTP